MDEQKFYIYHAERETVGHDVSLSHTLAYVEWCNLADERQWQGGDCCLQRDGPHVSTIRSLDLGGSRAVLSLTRI